ncbi:hypothetical protein M0R45_001591 [Rubus argutus]|uniref:Uncharacterized protein n=1 Tax=Rubus argutus TaxID=59490 RepID=A0AAW1VFF1_RUBAR
MYGLLRNGVVKGINEATMMEDMNLNVTERFRTICPVLVKIACRASEDEKAFSLALKFATELSNQVEDICFDNSTKSHDDLHNSSEGVGEMMEQDNSIENLLQNVKALKKKMSRKGRKKCPKA